MQQECVFKRKVCVRVEQKVTAIEPENETEGEKKGRYTENEK